MHPALRSFADELHATCGRLLAYIGALAMLAIVAAEFARTPPVIAVGAPAARPQWVAVARPTPAFDLSIAELADSDLRYMIFRHASGGRKDVMTWGEPAAAAPFARIEIYRAGAEDDHKTGLSDEFTADMAYIPDAGGIADAGLLDSKLGAFSLVDFTAAKSNSRRRCLGFARAYDEPAMRISGWYCNEGSELVERGIVACALDRLMLLSAGGDSRLADLFARAETGRKVCGLKDTHIAATPRRNDWIAGGETIALRGRFVAR